MSRRHTLALVIWYLLTPPTAKWTGEVLLTNKPLSKWDAHLSLIHSRVVRQHRIK